MQTVVRQDGESPRLSAAQEAIPARRESACITAHAPRLRARRELVGLCELWKQTRTDGGHVVEILGASGSGKSRLLAAFAERFHDEPARFLMVECRDRNVQPFSALKWLLDDHLQRIELSPASEGAGRKAALRAAAGPLAARIATLSPRFAELLPDRPQLEGMQQVFLESFVDFFARYAEAVGPSVWAIDDAQWLDPGSAVVLSSMVVRLKASGHLLVYAARNDLAYRQKIDLLRAKLPSARLTSMPLATLTSEELAELIGDYLGVDSPQEPALVRQLALLSDGTPLGALELLRLALEHGYLTQQHGQWALDASIHAMQLPAAAREYIGLRVSLLPQQTTHILRAAALLGTPIQSSLLALATGFETDAVECALQDGASARLLQLGGAGVYVFVHEGVAETLLRGMSLSARRLEHSQMAARLHTLDPDEVERSYLLARQYAAGDLEREPAAAFDALRRAARCALEACDDRLALSFLRPAADAARVAGIRLDREFHLDLAESSLRTGECHESRLYFEEALARSAAGLERAHVLGRIAWLHHYDADAQECWRALTAALAECGCATPSAGIAGKIADVVRVLAGRARRRALLAQPRGLETVCGLYVACMRTSLESRDDARFRGSALQLAPLAGRLLECRARVEADLMLALELACTGETAEADRRHRDAEAMAQRLADPISRTSCHRIRHAIHAWREDPGACEREALACLRWSHWMELGEFCQLCADMYALESWRGRPLQALCWVQRALDRMVWVGRAPAILGVLEQAACGALESMGRAAEGDALRERLSRVERADIPTGHSLHVLSFQARVQQLVARGKLGGKFEALVDEFDRLVKPDGLHPLLAVHYLQVAHARVQQCLQASNLERDALVKRFEHSLHCVRVTSRNDDSPHLRFLWAAQAWFDDAPERARRHLADAERAAERLLCPWVSCAAARLRGHMLRAEGDLEAAQEQATLAALLAQKDAQHAMLREIRREFELPLVARSYGAE
ncbi:MAG TPA: AAA family ATPase [Polyangiales bacterium]|nr:AAA family ATPase [Polyangiales bacterium]